MITLFTEQDLASFGTFLLSPERKDLYLEQGISEEGLPAVLSVVNTFDLTTWAKAQSTDKNTKEQPEKETNES